MSWRFFNIVVLFISLVGSIFSRVLPGFEYYNFNCFGLGLISLLAMVGVIFTCAMSNYMMDSEFFWDYPSISGRLDMVGQPFQLYAGVSCVAIAMALGTLFRNFIFGIQSLDWSFYACIGVGVFIGLFLCLKLFKNRLNV
ncbi:hypothetical protein [Xanthomonas albilineans]|uniref:hypothetical protein n=1 Tax=Xanthomonas albilineans TaxID=29447 RepID=UPI0011B06681|nr:hypothetical protein [Xanthomonas albilineans]